MKKENSDFLSGIESILSTRPSKLLWLVPSLIGMLVLFIILWLTFSQIDVIAPSLGKTIPSSRMILIQAKETSTIEKINVKNGQSVKKGDLLVEFRNNVENFDNSSMKAKYETLLLKKIFLEEMLKYIDTNNKEKEIENNEILKYVLNENDNYPYEEERRLFYVALTRTKNNVYLFVNKKNESIFVKEIVNNYKSCIQIFKNYL